MKYLKTFLLGSILVTGCQSSKQYPEVQAIGISDRDNNVCYIFTQDREGYQQLKHFQCNATPRFRAIIEEKKELLKRKAAKQ